MTNTKEIHIGIIGGSGLGDAIAGESGQTINPDTPFGKPSSPIIQTTWQDIKVSIIQRHGIGHTINPSRVPYQANIFALKSIGVTHIIASGATGSLREEIAPGDIVIADQIIDKTCKRANTFYDGAAVHVEFTEPFCPVMRRWLLNAAKNLATKLPGTTIHSKGTYVTMEGPAFSTVAESNMHRGWGGDLIGMTVMPEAKLAREAELPYALVALPTDYDCWRPHDPNIAQQDLLSEIIGNLNKASTAGLELIKAALADITILTENSCPAHKALTLAIWSDKSKIEQAEVERLNVLWGKYFK